MSCEGNRHKFFQVASDDVLTAETLERIYQANRGQAASQGEALAAEAKTRALFAQMERMGIKPPTHAADGLPKKASQAGYAAVFDALQRRAQEEQEEEEQAAQLSLAMQQEDGETWYDPEGFDIDGYDREGYDRDGFDKEGYNRYGYDIDGFDRSGFDSLGYDKSLRDREGYDYLGYDRQGYDRDGYDKDGYDREGFDRGGYDRDGYDKTGNRHPFFSPDEKGLLGDGRDRYGFDAEGYNAHGYDRNGFDREGFNQYGYDRAGYDQHGINHKGIDDQGYSAKGYRKDKDRHQLVDRFGFDEHGFGPDGYTVTGYDHNGRDREGKRRERRFVRGKSGKRLKARFCKSGWDQDGYDRWGFHKDDGLTAPGEDGKRRNWLGWVYDEQRRVCYNPDDPSQEMAWGGERFRYLKPRFGSRYVRGGYRMEGTITGRVEPRKSVLRGEAGNSYQPVQADPHKEISFEDFAQGRPHWWREGKLRAVYQHTRTNGLVTEGMQEEHLRSRWKVSAARAKAGGDKVVADGRRLRCPHCGQFTGGELHQCPSFQGQQVQVTVKGRVFAGVGPKILYDPDPDKAEAVQYPDGYSARAPYGRDADGYDRRGYDSRGFNRDGFDGEGYDRLGYDQDGYDREGYDRDGLDREGRERPATLETVAPMLDQGDDLLANEDLADLYGRIATGLVGEPRRVILEEGGGFGTDMKGMIKADPYPLGRDADPRANLVVTRAGIHHELGHELFTDPAVWAQVLAVAEGEQAMDDLGSGGAKLLPDLFNVVEDGRMERRLASDYAGVAEVLAASCRLEPRWDQTVGEGVSVGNQLFGAALYRSLPFLGVPAEKQEQMDPKARRLYEEFEPVIGQAVGGSADDAFSAAVYMARRLEEEGLIQPPSQQNVVLKPPPRPPKGTKPRKGRPGGQSRPMESGQQGTSSQRSAGQEEQRKGRKSGQKDEQEGGGSGRSSKAQDDPKGTGRQAGSGKDDQRKGRKRGRQEDPESSGGKRGSEKPDDDQQRSGGQSSSGDVDDEDKGRKPSKQDNPESGSGKAGSKKDDEQDGAGGSGSSSQEEDDPKGTDQRGGSGDDDGAGTERGSAQQEDPESDGDKAGSGKDDEQQSSGGGQSRSGDAGDEGKGQKSGQQEDQDSAVGHPGSGEHDDDQKTGDGQQGGLGGDIQDAGAGNDFGPMDNDALENVLAHIEEETSRAIENGVKRRNTPIKVGQQLHRPLPQDRKGARQAYYDGRGKLTRAPVAFLKEDDLQLQKELAARAKEHRKVATMMARQLKRIREQTAQRMRRQTQGRLDRHQLVNAYKGLDDVRTTRKQQDRTSFAVSIAVDQSGSMGGEVRNKNLYDAAMTLAQTLEQLEMAYEVRGFGSTSAQYKAMDDSHFAPSRAAVLASSTLGGTQMKDTAGLAAQSLLAREESNRLFVSLTDGQLGDHQETVAVMAQARQQGVVTFGIYLGRGADVGRMDEIYGRGNWTTIEELSDLPKQVGQRIATIFKSIR